MTRERIVVHGDSREYLESVEDSCVQTIITSPPYGTLKDYGYENQIGFGQAGEGEYYDSLEQICEELYRIARDGAAFWVILDGWKTDGRYIHFPSKFILIAEAAGWILQDVLIWDKGRTLPWTHNGRFRNSSETILLFSKKKLRVFNLSKLRDANDLSSYWVRYPERYHPMGKAPSDIWHFPIPVQGSWTSSSKRHFCPLPLEMVGRMIELTSDVSDLIVDPFSGTGTVPAVARFLARDSLGIEANPEFVSNFYAAWFDEMKKEWASKCVKTDSLQSSTLINLRAQKFPKTLFLGLSKSDNSRHDAGKDIEAFILTFRGYSEEQFGEGSEYGIGQLYVILRQSSKRDRYLKAIAQLLERPPLSKFGLRIDVRVVSSYPPSISRILNRRKEWHVYVSGKFYGPSKKFDPKKSRLKDLLADESKLKKFPPIISNLRVSVPKALL